jgi:hypothetical protein
MKRALVVVIALVFVAPLLAQRPSDPALLVPESAMTDHRLAISPSDAAVFQPSDPPSVSMAEG